MAADEDELANYIPFDPDDPHGFVASVADEDPSGGISRTLDNAEVRANIQEWVQPIADEVHSLETKQAIERLGPAEAKQFLRNILTLPYTPLRAFSSKTSSGRKAQT